MLVTKSVISTKDIINYSTSADYSTTGGRFLYSDPLPDGYLYTIINFTAFLTSGAASYIGMSLSTDTILVIANLNNPPIKTYIRNTSWFYAKPGDKLAVYSQITTVPASVTLQYQAIRVPST